MSRSRRRSRWRRSLALRATVSKALASFTAAQPALDEAQRHAEESRELRDLEAYLLEGRNAENSGRRAHGARGIQDTERAIQRNRTSQVSRREVGLLVRSREEPGCLRKSACRRRLQDGTGGTPTRAHSMPERSNRVADDAGRGRDRAARRQRSGRRSADWCEPGARQDSQRCLLKVEATLAGFEPASLTTDPTSSGRIRLLLSPKPLWSVSIDAAPSGAGIVRDRSWYVADRKGGIRAIDCDSGIVRWTKSVESLSGIIGDPTTAGNLVFVATVEGALYAFEASSGRESWHVSMPSSLDSGPVLVGTSLVLIGSNDSAYIVSLDNPERLRRVPLQTHATTAPVAGADRWCVGSNDGSVLCFDLAGELRWRSLAGPGIEVLRRQKNGTWLATAGTNVTSVDPETGAVLTTIELPSGPTIFAESPDQRLWLVCADGVAEFDTQRWELGPRIPAPGSQVTGLQCQGNGFLMAAAGEVYATNSDGSLLWSRASLQKPRVVALTKDTLGIVDERGQAFALRGCHRLRIICHRDRHRSGNVGKQPV